MKKIILFAAAMGGVILCGAPHVGFVHPSGGQAGTAVNVVIGGQNLGGCRTALLSGSGVTVERVEPVQGFPRVGGDQLRFLTQWLLNLEAGNKEMPKKPDNTDHWRLHPWFDKLDRLDEAQLEMVRETLYRTYNSLQMSPSINGRLLLRLRIAPDAAPGKRELRLVGWGGASNPVPFFIGTAPEKVEAMMLIRNKKKPIPLISVPGVWNGQIMPGECDHCDFEAKAGEKVLFHLRGRELVPFMGDCVPGHFQGLIEIADASGKVIARADDWGNDPDPRLNFTVPATGRYRVAIRDALYRGREDFTYRLEISYGELKFALTDLPRWPIPMVQARSGESVAHPAQLRGELAIPGKADCYKIHLAKDECVALEIFARRGGSPLDSVLSVHDAAGKCLALNDDAPRPPAGIIMHAADSALLFKAPAEGEYLVKVADRSDRAGTMFQYLLRIDRPRPGAKVYCAPSFLAVSRDGQPVRFLIERLDGFNGEVQLEAPAGFRWLGVSALPAKCSSSVALLGVDNTPGRSNAPLPQKLCARVGEALIEIIPCDEAMQAFAYTHFVPAQQLWITQRGRGGKKVPPEPVVALAAGKEAELTLPLQKLPENAEISCELENPPAGLHVVSSKAENGTLKLRLGADDKMAVQEFNQLVRMNILTYKENKEGKKKPVVRKLYLPNMRITVTQGENK